VFFYFLYFCQWIYVVMFFFPHRFSHFLLRHFFLLFNWIETFFVSLQKDCTICTSAPLSHYFKAQSFISMLILERKSQLYQLGNGFCSDDLPISKYRETCQIVNTYHLIHVKHKLGTTSETSIWVQPVVF
jgi:hypothetical protein